MYIDDDECSRFLLGLESSASVRQVLAWIRTHKRNEWRNTWPKCKADWHWYYEYAINMGTLWGVQIGINRSGTHYVGIRVEDADQTISCGITADCPLEMAIASLRRQQEHRMIRKRTSAEQAVKVDAGDEHDFIRGLPTLYEYMTSTSYDDGSARRTASLTIYLSDGLFKVVMKDNDTSEVCFTSGGTMTEVLCNLESNLSSGNCDWRQDKYAGGQRRGGVGKR